MDKHTLKFLELQKYKSLTICVWIHHPLLPPGLPLPTSRNVPLLIRVRELELVFLKRNEKDLEQEKDFYAPVVLYDKDCLKYKEAERAEKF